MVVETFGNILRELRKEKKLSQEKLAELCDLHDRYISFLERGIKQPTVTTIFKIAKALNIPASEIIKMMEDKMKENETGTVQK